MKRAVQDSQGHLRMGYWEGNEALKGTAVVIDNLHSATTAEPGWTAKGTTIQAKAIRGTSMMILDPNFDLQKGIILEGKVSVTRTGASLAGAGFFIEEKGGRGTAVLAQTNGETEFGIFGQSGLGRGFVADDSVESGIIPSKEYRFRLLLRRDLMELYLDDQLVQCYSLPLEPHSGRIGLLVANATASFDNLRAWEMTLPAK